ncbi:hypothetical protein [Shimia sp. R9_3]|uniref:hypothetical protein n=1 Tax=Shimia sp. R9_3 TaxID=2821113 RepID=UPI001ADCA2BA|nr:hypothetical protein [Shimia sp. R9_3]MBO9402567.1 hypothetical protein [Shimia sp. R9_3]
MFGSLEENTALPSRDDTKSHLLRLLGIGLISFVMAMLTRVGLINHPLIYDELYQYLPSVSWQENQTFTVLDGIYDRAARFSQFIAFSFDVIGEQSAFSARLIPSVIPGALLVALIVSWAYHVSGRVAALIALCFLLFWPNGIEVSQYIRFYSAQGVLFVGGALLVYTALTEITSVIWRAAALVAAAVAFLVALDLQMLTALGVGAILLWVLVVFMPGWLRRYPLLWWLNGAIVLGLAIFFLSGVASEEINWLWTTYNWEPWPHVDDTTFYHRNFRDNYPTFWTLFPVIAIIALRANFMPASFCLALFVTTFLLQSFGGLKNIRYLYPTMPFFFVLWGIGLQAVLPVFWRFLKTSATEASGNFVPSVMKKPLAFAVLGISAGFLIFANPALPRSAKLILGQDENMLLGKTRWQWEGAEAFLTPWLADNPLIVTDEEMRAVEWLGDFDLAYNKPRFSELLYSVSPDAPPFSVDRRTGRPLIGDYADFRLVVFCHPVGVFVTNEAGARNGNILRLLQEARSADLSVSLQTGRGMAMVGWRHKAQMELPEDCRKVPNFGDPSAAGRILSGESVPWSVASSTVRTH